MSVWLDLVRGVAALSVAVGHTVSWGIYTGPYPFSRALQHNAVVVFFVLSGIVIAASSGPGRSLRDFALARVSRIVPAALGAIAVSLAVAAFDASHGDGMLFQEHGYWTESRFTIRAVLFLSESYTTNFIFNPVYWSLCYEVWYYALFAAATYLRGPGRLVWLVLLAVLAGPNAMLMLPCWLVGVAVARYGGTLRLVPAAAWACVALGLASLYVMQMVAQPLNHALDAVIPWQRNFSYRALPDFLIAAAVGIGFVGLRSLAEAGFVPPDLKAIRALAGLSFSLYLLHLPLLKLLRILGLEPSANPLALLAVMSVIVALSAAFAAVTEHRRHIFRRALEGLLQSRRRLSAA